jgi:hypothetical protein
MTIIRTNYADEQVQLVNETSGAPVRIGQTVTDFRGNKSILTGAEAPHKESSTGRVYAKTNAYASTATSFYPSVFGLKWTAVI